MILGLSGLAGSGKDTLANYLKVTHGFRPIAFADPIKQFCHTILQFSTEHLYGDSAYRNEESVRYTEKATWDHINVQLHTLGGEWVAEVAGGPNRGMFLSLVDVIEKFAEARKPLSAREALQVIGTEWGRAHDSEMWVKYAVRRAQRAHKAVITDIRFINELEAVQQAPGTVIRVLRDAPRSAAFNKHLSETELNAIPLEKFDKVLDNNRPLIEVYEDLDEVVSEAR